MAYLAVVFMLVAVDTKKEQAFEFYGAVEDGDVEKVKRLLAKNPALIEWNEPGWTPLQRAARDGHLAVVKFLLENKANVNARDYNHNTPLHLAGAPGVVQELLRHKPDLNARNTSCETPLEGAAASLACWSRNGQQSQATVRARKVVKLLLDAGAPYDIYSAIYLNDIEQVRSLLKQDGTLVQDTHHGKMRPLRLAACEGRADICKLLLTYKADSGEIGGPSGYPVLYDAIGHAEVVELLLAAGASAQVKVQGINRISTILHYAAEKGAVQSCKVVLRRGLKADTLDGAGSTPLHIAAYYKQAEMVRFLLDQGVPVDAKDKEGFTALQLAASWGDRRAVHFLLKKNADPRVRDPQGNTPMTLAACSVLGPPRYSRERTEENAQRRVIIRELESRGVAVDLPAAIALGDVKRARQLLKHDPALAKNKNEDKPFIMWAALLDDRDMVSLLLQSGAQPDAKDEDGFNALHSTATWGLEEMARLLIRAGADVNALDDNGATPLHASARQTTIRIANVLLAAGARVNHRNWQRKTPLWYAKRGAGNRAAVNEMIELLRKNGGTE